MIIWEFCFIILLNITLCRIKNPCYTLNDNFMVIYICFISITCRRKKKFTKSHMWLVAMILDSAYLDNISNITESSTKLVYIPYIYFLCYLYTIEIRYNKTGEAIVNKLNIKDWYVQLPNTNIKREIQFYYTNQVK